MSCQILNKDNACVKTRVFDLKNLPVGPEGCTACPDCSGSCYCIFVGVFCGCCLPLEIGNADVNISIRQSTVFLDFTPSEFVQFTVVSKPERNSFFTTTSRFPSIENLNKTRAFIQFLDRQSILRSRQIIFEGEIIGYVKNYNASKNIITINETDMIIDNEIGCGKGFDRQSNVMYKVKDDAIFKIMKTMGASNEIDTDKSGFHSRIEEYKALQNKDDFGGMLVRLSIKNHIVEKVTEFCITESN